MGNPLDLGFCFFIHTGGCKEQRKGSTAGKYADMAELADAPDLGSGVHDVQVQVLLSALKSPLMNCRYSFSRDFFILDVAVLFLCR